jgi:IS30 family transposase
MSISITTNRRSTLGRPRRVTDAMIAEILRWYATHCTAKQKARELGIGTSTVHQVIRSGGTHFKQPSPEHRHTAIESMNRRRTELRDAHWI